MVLECTGKFLTHATLDGHLKRETTKDEVNALFMEPASGELAGILGFEPRPLVSADYARDTRSSLTDGALRMLVLLHFFHLGYSPFVLSFLFLLYEAAGIAANFIGGWLATRFGITRMLAVGLTTQITGFLVLPALSPDWATALSVAWVVAAQGICGVAKDLTKTASKSAIKVAEKEARAEDAEGRLFRWVAWFTGSKNAMKGFGFFLGGVLLQMLGFRLPLWVMAAEDVGFYYAANAAGRFSGTLLSGLLYQWGGITACPAGSALMLAACFLTTLALPLRRYS